MTDRPVLFSAPMVRALLGGRKTQTRRVLKPQPDPRRISDVAFVNDVWCWRNGHDGSLEGRVRLPCAPGDRLWVREAWHPVMEGHPVILCKADNRIVYHDTGRAEPNIIYKQPSRWRPSIHMPRWASRLTLIVTDVRVQRVQEISEEDARAEGITDGGCLECGRPEPCGCLNPSPDARDSFAYLWNSIHGQDAWLANPWVCALSFRCIPKNIDQMEREDAS